MRIPPAETDSDPVEVEGRNVLLMILDDLGLEQIAAYGMSDKVAPTPNIDALAAEGVMFRRAWSNPSCSPSRASMLTGRHGRRTGIGRWIYPIETTYPLPLDEVSIPEMLAYSEDSWTTSAVGKWHLSDRSAGRVDHPTDSGFDWFSGTLANVENFSGPNPGGTVDYYHHQIARDGELVWMDGYLTSETVDDAIDRVAAMPEPWFMWLAFNAPHLPIHAPPADLHSYDLTPESPGLDQYHAMVEALDTEIGRLLASIDPDELARTTIILVGDNGSSSYAIPAPFDPTRSKATTYEGGVNVPLVVTGPLVSQPGTESDALVHLVDVFATVAELAGVSMDEVADERTGEPVVVDSQSFVPYVREPSTPSEREFLYTEGFYDNGPGPYSEDQKAVRNDTHKVIQVIGVDTRFYEFVGYFDEGEPLVLDALTPEQTASLEDLTAEMDRRNAELVFDH